MALDVLRDDRVLDRRRPRRIPTPHNHSASSSSSFSFSMRKARKKECHFNVTPSLSLSLSNSHLLLSLEGVVSSLSDEAGEMVAIMAATALPPSASANR